MKTKKILKTPWRLLAMLIISLLVSCTSMSPFEKARQKNSSFAYRAFIRHNPKHPKVEQATKLEAEAAFRELGEKPNTEKLKAYLAKYPDSHLFEQVQMRLLETKLAYYIKNRYIAGLKRLMKTCEDEAVLERMKESYDYLVGAKKAILKLDRKYFEEYLRKHQGGEFSEHARSTVKWMKS
ncbi:MAG: hypothetical protein JRJ19_14160, partial [Deltaproteobacteria bacterium]|nr:hypothetical protein [Deltaproteobacteria bacterium]